MAGERVIWGYPVKTLKKAQKKLEGDLKFYGGCGAGNCAKLDERTPKIIAKRHKDGSLWYHTEVDDVLLPLAVGGKG